MSRHGLIESARLDFHNGLRKLKSAGGDKLQNLGWAMTSIQKALEWVDITLVDLRTGEKSE